MSENVVWKDKELSTKPSSSNWADLPEDVKDNSIVSTTCGHLFHICLANWLKICLQHLREGHSTKKCLHCKNLLISLDYKCPKVFKIYPVFSEWSDKEEGSTGHDDQGIEVKKSQIQIEEDIQTLTKIMNISQAKNKQILQIMWLLLEYQDPEIKKMEMLKTLMDFKEIISYFEYKNRYLKSERSKLLRNMENRVLPPNECFIKPEKLKAKPSAKAKVETCSKYIQTEPIEPEEHKELVNTGDEIMPNPPILPPKYYTGRAAREPYNQEFKLGDRVLYRSSSVLSGPLPYAGVIKSLYLNRFGRRIAGVEFDKTIPHGMSGLFSIRQYFTCRPKHGRLIEESRLTKFETIPRGPVSSFSFGFRSFSQ